MASDRIDSSARAAPPSRWRAGRIARRRSAGCVSRSLL